MLGIERLDMTIFERIKELADKQGKSLQKVSEDLGLSQNYIYNLKGAKSPAADKLALIADYFQVSVDYLLGRYKYDDTINYTLAIAQYIVNNYKVGDRIRDPRSNGLEVTLTDSLFASYKSVVDQYNRLKHSNNVITVNDLSDYELFILKNIVNSFSRLSEEGQKELETFADYLAERKNKTKVNNPIRELTRKTKLAPPPSEKK
jgi:transcriptional regulator with XRE-family HTH domain